MSKIILRPHQQEAHDAVIEHWQNGGGNPLIDHCVGSGKSLTQAAIATTVVQRWGARVLGLTMTKELIGQNFKEMRAYWPDAPVGLNSAGLKRRDTNLPIIFAHPLSIVRNVRALGQRHVIMIDEVHNVSRKEESSTYGKIITQLRDAVPDLRIVGLTGTAYRLDSGLLWEPWKGKQSMWDEPVHTYNMLDGIRDGYLVPVIPRPGGVALSSAGVGTRGGEYIDSQVQKAVDKADLNRAIVSDIITKTVDRNSVLVFAAGVEHAQHLHDEFVKTGASAVVVHGDLDDAVRDERIDYFKRGAAKFAINVGILTTGFNHPPCDAVALVMMTKSKGKLVQILGRVMRAHPGKPNALALDYGGSIRELGCIDQLVQSKVAGAPGKAPTKTCPGCDTIVPASTLKCEHCGHEWEKPTPALSTVAQDAAILSTQLEAKWFDVQSVHYGMHEKRDPATGIAMPRSLRIDYYCGGSVNVSEFLAFAHPKPGARTMAQRKWRARSTGDVMPTTAEEALGIVSDLRKPARLQLRKNGKYWEIVALDYTIAQKDGATRNMMSDAEARALVNV